MIDPHPLWHALQQHILKSIPEYTAILGLLFVAVIANMPHPDVIQKLLGDAKFAQWMGVGYKWFYDSLQAFMSSRQPQRPLPEPTSVPVPIPTPPNPPSSPQPNEPPRP